MKMTALVSIVCGLLLSPGVLLSGERSTQTGVRIDGSGVTADQVTALRAIVKSASAKLRPACVSRRELDVINAEVAKIPVAGCYLPGTPLEKIARQEGALAAAQPNFNLSSSSWASSPGTPVHLTVSLVPDGTPIPAANSISGDTAGNSVLFERMNALFASRGGESEWMSRIMQAFDRWAELTGTSYTFVGDDGVPLRSAPGLAGVRGDIRIGMRPIDGSLNIGAFNAFPPDGDMVLDSAENWAGDPLTDFLPLRNIVAHEHGHGLGLRHVCPNNRTKLMEPIIFTNFDGPQQDDIRGVHVKYGDAFESGTVSLGTITTAGQVLLSPSTLPGTVTGIATLDARRTSIHGAGDTDRFRFSLSSPRITTITVAPIGTTYQSSCTDTSTQDALRQANLAFEVSGSVLGLPISFTVNSRGRGFAESFSTATPAGTWTIRVFSSDTPSGPQLYDLSVATSVIGTFGLEPAEATAAVQKPITYTFSWTTPEPLNWHDLRQLHFLIREGEDILLLVRFNEADRSFSVYNDESHRFSKPEIAGSKKKLQTQYAELDLAETSVMAIDPTSPTVTLKLALNFKPKATGRTCTIEVAASDDFGNSDDFVEAGTLTITAKSKNKANKSAKEKIFTDEELDPEPPSALR